MLVKRSSGIVEVVWDKKNELWYWIVWFMGYEEWEVMLVSMDSFGKVEVIS